MGFLVIVALLILVTFPVIAALPVIVMDPKLVLERHHVVSSPGEEPHSFNQGDEEILPCLHIFN